MPTRLEGRIADSVPSSESHGRSELAAQTYDLQVDQGAHWFWTVTWKEGHSQKTAQPKNLTGYTGRMQMRTKPGATGAPSVTLTTENGGINITPSTGQVTATMTATATAALTAGKYVYDLELVDSTGVVTKLARGTVTVIREVTR